MSEMKKMPKIALGAWAWGNDGTFGGNLTLEQLRPVFDAADPTADNAVTTMYGTSATLLGTDYMDIYWIHNPVGAPEWIRKLIPLAKMGKIGRRFVPECDPLLGERDEIRRDSR